MRRRCKICGTPLSDLNKNEQCFRHLEDIDDRESTRHTIVKESQRPSSSQAPPLLEDIAKSEMTSEAILKTIGSLYGVSLEQLLGKGRRARLSWARHVAMYLFKIDLHMSLPRIGKVLNRDHTSVLHGYRKIRVAVEQDAETSRIVAFIRESYLSR